jgi:hypothetical protein
VNPYTIRSALVANGYTGIFAFPLDGSNAVLSYTPVGLQSSSNLVSFGGCVYFCDDRGTLYGLGLNMEPLAGLPQTILSGALYAPLTVLPDVGEQGTLLLSDALANVLYSYDLAGGGVGQLGTNQTGFMCLSEVSSDGMIYGGGAAATNLLGQVFGIRAGSLPPLRSFVVESQLLQDFDPGASPIARFQTHVTILDDSMTPRPFTGVKLWADSLSSIQVDGRPYTVGPNAPLSTQADANGSLRIMSDATDLFATPLRLWAAFMDPFERIVVYPDREFHGRLPAMIADPANDDPTLINLATGTTYAGDLLFPNQQQAQTTATTIAAVCQATGMAANPVEGGNGLVETAPRSKTLAPYTAYNDLPGMQYLACNVPTLRQVSVQNPLGMAWSVATPGEYTLLSFSAAAAGIDSLSGMPNALLRGAGTGGLRFSLGDLWDDIKRGVASVTQVVVSIGAVVYVGIQYVVNDIRQVFRFVVHKVEDLVSTIGALFIALVNDIRKVIELLSLLLHFQKVIDTHQKLMTALLLQVEGLAEAIAVSGVPAVNSIFSALENTLTSAF